MSTTGQLSVQSHVHTHTHAPQRHRHTHARACGRAGSFCPGFVDQTTTNFLLTCFISTCGVITGGSKIPSSSRIRVKPAAAHSCIDWKDGVSCSNLPNRTTPLVTTSQKRTQGLVFSITSRLPDQQAFIFSKQTVRFRFVSKAALDVPD